MHIDRSDDDVELKQRSGREKKLEFLTEEYFSNNQWQIECALYFSREALISEYRYSGYVTSFPPDDMCKRVD